MIANKWLIYVHMGFQITQNATMNTTHSITVGSSDESLYWLTNDMGEIADMQMSNENRTRNANITDTGRNEGLAQLSAILYHWFADIYAIICSFQYKNYKKLLKWSICESAALILTPCNTHSRRKIPIICHQFNIGFTI
ncbi:uncharacterized protein LOC128240940 [Mya arenaria]|uniref:uncharacterized protein LOC128240940 n=1 Tax=Mya arenaria TaxID=6604 RepID=UPI0022E21A05|nr:uncharacterized protein LOC128240940 [Mya arenaria]